MKEPASVPRHIPVLDGVRALAVVAVVVAHFGYRYYPGGGLGVDLFFVLSGFLITGLLIREFDESGNIRLDLFYLRRLFRILPPVLLVLVLASVLRPVIMVVWSQSWTVGYWTSMAAVLFFFANYYFERLGPLAHAWSLSIEEQFYLIWPALLIVILSRLRFRSALPLIVCTCIVGCALLRACLEYGGFDNRDLYSCTPLRIDSLLMGSLAAIVLDSHSIKTAAHRLSRWRIPELILSGFVLQGFFLNERDSFFYYGGFTLVAFLAALLLLCLVHEQKGRWYRSILECPLSIWLGRRSYGIYLYHYPLFFALEVLRVPHSFSNFVLVTFLRIVLTLGISELSYRYIEAPFLRRKSHLNWREYLKV